MGKGRGEAKQVYDLWGTNQDTDPFVEDLSDEID